MLSNLLIEDLVIELLGWPVHQPVIKLSSMRLNQVHLSRGGTIGQLVGPAFGIGIYTLLVHHFFVREGCVLHWNQALSWRRMLPHVVVEEARLTCVLLDIVIHDPMEPFIFAAKTCLLSVLKQLIEQRIILSLDGLGLILKFFVSIERLRVAWLRQRAPRLFAGRIRQFLRWLHLSGLWWRNRDRGKRDLHVICTSADIIAVHAGVRRIFSNVLFDKLGLSLGARWSCLLLVWGGTGQLFGLLFLRRRGLQLSEADSWELRGINSWLGIWCSYRFLYIFGFVSTIGNSILKIVFWLLNLIGRLVSICFILLIGDSLLSLIDLDINWIVNFLRRLWPLPLLIVCLDGLLIIRSLLVRRSLVEGRIMLASLAERAQRLLILDTSPVFKVGLAYRCYTTIII